MKIYVLLFLAIATVLASPFFGMTIISPQAVFLPENPESLIFWHLRMPRALGAFLAGAGLALGGLIFQAMFRNPLATPFTLGVSSGAALGAAVYFHLTSVAVLFGAWGALVFSLTGCALSIFLVHFISRSGGFSTRTLLLGGVIINFFFSSLVMFVQFASNSQDALRIMHWLMGSINIMNVWVLAELAAAVFAVWGLVWKISTELDLLTAGEDLAASRGVNVRFIKLVCFLAASVLVGVIVSVTGPIGFVGMVIPQICRLWLGFRHEILVPASVLLGGIFLVVCDAGARILLAPAELPIGILTALLGAPFFLWTLVSSQKDSYFL